MVMTASLGGLTWSSPYTWPASWVATSWTSNFPASPVADQSRSELKVMLKLRIVLVVALMLRPVTATVVPPSGAHEIVLLPPPPDTVGEAESAACQVLKPACTAVAALPPRPDPLVSIV